MKKKILLAVLATPDQQPLLAGEANTFLHDDYSVDVKRVVNIHSLNSAQRDQLAADKQHVIILEDSLGLGKIHKIVFEYSRRKLYDFVILAGPQQFEYFKTHFTQLAARLGEDIAYLTGGDPVSSQFGIINYVQRKVFKRQLNLFPKICIYNTRYLEKIPYLYNSDDDAFVNEIAIQIVLSDFNYHQVESDIRVKIPSGAKLRTLRVFFRAYIHSLGIFYQNMFDIIPDNLQYSLKLGYASSHTYAIDAVTAGSKVIDIGAGPFGIGHELKKKNCSVVTVDQFDIPQKYKLDEHIVTNLDDKFSISIKEYDCILFLDIIEHLVNPEAFIFNLSEQFSYRKQRIIFTTGNISFFPVRMMLLLGYFNYGKSGILDKTHTRLFTFSSFKKLITDARMKIISVKGIPAPYPKAIGDNFISRAMLAVNLFLIKILPGLFSYQIYIEAETAPSVYYIVNQVLEDEKVL